MVCRLVGHFQTSSIGAKMELSNYSYFPAEIARGAQKAAQCWGDSHVSGSCSPGNPSLALWLLSVEGIRV